MKTAATPHAVTVAFALVTLLFSAAGLLKAAGQTATVNGNISGGSAVINTGTINNVGPAPAAPRIGGGFGCENSKGVKMFNNYSHDNAGDGFGLHGCDDAEVTGNISEHNGYPLGKK
jgi:hypothetical protein